MEDAKIKKIIGISTLAIILGIIGLIVGKEIISKAKVKKSAQTSEKIQAEDIYHLDDVILTILNDETPLSMGLLCEGVYTYVSGQEVAYLLSSRTDNTVKQSDNTWVKLESTSTVSLSVKGSEDSGAGSQDEKTVSYLKISEDKNTQYTDDGTGQWFYTEFPITEFEEKIPSKEKLKPFVDILYKNSNIVEKEGQTIIASTLYTRDTELVDVLNEIGSTYLLQTLFAGMMDHETTVTLSFIFEEGTFTAYQIETTDKEYAFEYFKDWSGYSDGNAIISSAAVRVLLKMPQTSEFDIPSEVLSAISEEEWLSKEEEEKKEEPTSEEPASDIPPEKSSEQGKEPEISEEHPYKIDITDKSSVFDYLKEQIYGNSDIKEEEVPQTSEEKGLTIEEIREQYGEDLDKMLDDYEKN